MHIERGKKKRATNLKLCDVARTNLAIVENGDLLLLRPLFLLLLSAKPERARLAVAVSACVAEAKPEVDRVATHPHRFPVDRTAWRSLCRRRPRV